MTTDETTCVGEVAGEGTGEGTAEGTVEGTVETVAEPAAEEHGGDGGNLSFHSGRGGPPDGKDGSIIWYIGDDKEVLRFDPDGKIYVQGRLAETDQMVVTAFKLWLMTSMHGVSVTQCLSHMKRRIEEHCAECLKAEVPAPEIR